MFDVVPSSLTAYFAVRYYYVLTLASFPLSTTNLYLLLFYSPPQGYNSPREFIVTQGPLASTRDDYWRMCWESTSRAMIMLTRCIEKVRE